MIKKFMKFGKVVRVVLLVVPFLNWIVEIILRWGNFLEKKDAGSLVVALIATLGLGVILGWIDAIFTVLEDRLVLTDLKL